MRVVPTFQAAAIGVPVSEPRSIGPLRRAAIRAAQNLSIFFFVDSHKRIETLNNHTEEELAAQPDKVIVHNNIKGNNILVLSDGRVYGLLNWADATMGDPAEDIARLSISLGAIAAVKVAIMVRYPLAVSLRGLCLARCETLIRLDGFQNNHEFFLHRLQFERAWQHTTLDPDSCSPKTEPLTK
jgi:hypothetical protein